MEYFKPGTRVKCINDSSATYLTYSEVYTTVSCERALRPDAFLVDLEEIPEYHKYYTDRFVRIEDGEPTGGLSGFLERTK